MGAHKVDRRRRCGCGLAAHFEVFDSFRASHGYFCETCGNARVKRLDAEYARYHEVQESVKGPAPSNVGRAHSDAAARHPQGASNPKE